MPFPSNLPLLFYRISRLFSSYSFPIPLNFSRVSVLKIRVSYDSIETRYKYLAFPYLHFSPILNRRSNKFLCLFLLSCHFSSIVFRAIRSVRNGTLFLPIDYFFAPILCALPLIYSRKLELDVLLPRVK